MIDIGEWVRCVFFSFFANACRSFFLVPSSIRFLFSENEFIFFIIFFFCCAIVSAIKNVHFSFATEHSSPLLLYTHHAIHQDIDNRSRDKESWSKEKKIGIIWNFSFDSLKNAIASVSNGFLVENGFEMGKKIPDYSCDISFSVSQIFITIYPIFRCNCKYWSFM